VKVQNYSISSSRGIKLKGMDINVEDEVDMRSFEGISNDVSPGAQQFRVNINIKK
jgi:hypothetical protein